MTAAGDAAVFARLRSDAQLANAVYEGLVKDPPSRYVSVFAPIGVDNGDRLAGPSNVNTVTYTVHSVGVDVTQAKWVARRVNGLLKDFEPIPGQGQMEHTVSRPPAFDRDANPPLWYIVDEYDLTSS